MVENGARHPPAQQPARQQRARQDVAPAVLDPVQQRSHERGEHSERCHGDEQGKRDLTAGLANRDAEEQRARQRDGHEGIADAAGRRQLDEAGQAGAPGPGGPRQPLDHAAGAAAGGCPHPRARLGGGRDPPRCPPGSEPAVRPSHGSKYSAHWRALRIGGLARTLVARQQPECWGI